jgi:hypothetical protein
VLNIAWRSKFKKKIYIYMYIFRRGKTLRLRKVDIFNTDEINVDI